MFIKDPDARLDYSVDWTDFLTDGDTITAHEWIAYSEDITVDGEQLVGNVHTTFVAGGIVGRAYPVTSRVTTALGRVNDSTIYILVREQ